MIDRALLTALIAATAAGLIGLGWLFGDDIGFRRGWRAALNAERAAQIGQQHHRHLMRVPGCPHCERTQP